MRYKEPLKKILSQKRTHWDHDITPRSVRSAFAAVLKCRTQELGAEVFRSQNQELILYHTCKSRGCPSCGHRASVQWFRERWAALPNIIYKGITLTMPNTLWPFFRDNPRLAKALPALAAAVIESWVGTRCSLRVGIIAILHTFTGTLEFNSHVHTMVTGGGLCQSSDTWVPRVYYDRDTLMGYWRRAVIRLLCTALRTGHLYTKMTADQVNALLIEQENRWWSIKIQSFQSKDRFLRYAGRYVRRPPIAQRRITHIGERAVTFWAKDKKSGRRVNVECSLEEFIDRWAQHIPEHYQHAVRNFGLFAPRAISQTSAAVFTILGQQPWPRPKPRPWVDSIKRDFGYDPLLDQTGTRMKWVGRLAPKAPPAARGGRPAGNNASGENP